MDPGFQQSSTPKGLETITIEVPGEPLCKVKIGFEGRIYKIPNLYAQIWFDWQYRSLAQYQELLQFQKLMRESSKSSIQKD